MISAKKLGWTEIDCIIGSSDKEIDVLLDNLTENLHRSDITLSEQGRGFVALMKQHNLTLAEVAARLGLKPKYITDAIEIFKHVPEEYRDKVSFLTPGAKKNGKIPARTANYISSHARTNSLPMKETKALYEYASKEETSFPKIKAATKLMANGMSLEQALSKSDTVKRIRFDIVIQMSDVKRVEKKYGKKINVVVEKIIHSHPDFRNIVITRKQLSMDRRKKEVLQRSHEL